MDAITALKWMNAEKIKKVPQEAPTRFVPRRWEQLVFTDDGISRRFYELCALSELKNALRSGDIWIHGSRQFKDFNEYLLPKDKFVALHEQRGLPLAVSTNCEHYLSERFAL